VSQIAAPEQDVAIPQTTKSIKAGGVPIGLTVLLRQPDVQAK
jgi:hypothetical protein